MTFPEWAPQILIDEHTKWSETGRPERDVYRVDPYEFFGEITRITGAEMAAADADNFRTLWYRTGLFSLPVNEYNALLELLITDLRMKNVWKAISKRVKTDWHFYEFFKACEDAIIGWRMNPKQTTSERRAFYQKIRDTAESLLFLLQQSDKYHFHGDHQPSFLFQRLGIEDLVKKITAANPDPGNIAYKNSCDALMGAEGRFVLGVFGMLRYIAKKAGEFSEEENLVKHPNSRNADLCYFVRSLSAFCRRRYQRPLYNVVAVTAAVIFNRSNIDCDYVKKSIKR